MNSETRSISRVIPDLKITKKAIRADKKAAGKGRDYNESYYDKFYAMAGPILAGRLNASITAVASMITAAWEQAGRPNLIVHSPAGPKKRTRRGAKLER